MNTQTTFSYDKSLFDQCQMTQIRLGLEDELDVSIFAKTKFDSHAMIYW